MSAQTKESRLRKILSLSGWLQYERYEGREIKSEITEMMFTESEDFGAAVICSTCTGFKNPGQNGSSYCLVAADLTPGLKIRRSYPDVKIDRAVHIDNEDRVIKIIELKKEEDGVVIKYNNGREEKIKKVKRIVETVHELQLV